MKILIGILVWLIFLAFILIFNYGAHCRDDEIEEIMESRDHENRHP